MIRLAICLVLLALTVAWWVMFNRHKRRAWNTTGKPCTCKWCYIARGGP